MIEAQTKKLMLEILIDDAWEELRDTNNEPDVVKLEILAEQHYEELQELTRDDWEKAASRGQDLGYTEEILENIYHLVTENAQDPSL